MQGKTFYSLGVPWIKFSSPKYRVSLRQRTSFLIFAGWTVKAIAFKEVHAIPLVSAERKRGDKETSNRLFLYIHNCSKSLVHGATPFIYEKFNKG